MEPTIYRDLSALFSGGYNDFRIDGSHLCPKNWLIFNKLGQGLSLKGGFFLIFSQFCELAFMKKC